MPWQAPIAPAITSPLYDNVAMELSLKYVSTSYLVSKFLILMLNRDTVLYDFTNITVVSNLKYLSNKTLDKLYLLKPV